MQRGIDINIREHWRSHESDIRVSGSGIQSLENTVALLQYSNQVFYSKMAWTTNSGANYISTFNLGTPATPQTVTLNTSSSSLTLTIPSSGLEPNAVFQSWFNWGLPRVL